MFEYVLNGREARIVIDRGASRNAVPAAAWCELERCVRVANIGPAHVITLASADPTSFCAGADMRELCGIARDERARRRFVGSMESVFAAIRRANKPTVALVRGGCYGMGVALATACDLRVVSPDADFALTPARFGMAYPQADVDSLARLVGPGQAASLLLCGRRVDGREAHRIGLAETLDETEDFGAETVASIAGCALDGLQHLKAALQGRYGTRQRFVSSIGSADFQKFVRG